MRILAYSQLVNTHDNYDFLDAKTNQLAKDLTLSKISEFEQITKSATACKL